ncbi:DUF4350 domain-containing protein [Sessilibacter sp. MAH4]
MKIKVKILLAIIVCIAVLVTAFFFVFMESYTETKELGWSEKARINRFLAAQQFLEKNNATVEQANSLQQIENLADSDTIIINRYADVVSEQQKEKLLNWLSGGGHLVIALNDTDDQSLGNDLLSDLGFSVYYETYDYDSTDNTEPDDIDTQNTLESELEKIESDEAVVIAGDVDTSDQNSTKEEYITKLNFEGIPDELSINFPTLAIIDHEYFYADEGNYDDYKPFYWAGDKYGVRFIQMYVGDGLITVVSSTEIWSNNYLSADDNAYLLAVMTLNSSKVTFLLGSNFASLSTLMWKFSYELIISITFIVLLWLIHLGKRFTPPVTVNNHQRRSLIEHIKAVGNFHWKKKQPLLLVASLREEILRYTSFQRIGPSHSLNKSKSKQDITNWLSKTCNIDPQFVYKAIYQNEISSEAEFIEIIRTLQIVKLELSI